MHSDRGKLDRVHQKVNKFKGGSSCWTAPIKLFVNINYMETEKNYEQYWVSKIDKIPEALGFELNLELAQFRPTLVEAMRSKSDDLKDIAIKYQEHGEQVVNANQGKDFTLAQIGQSIDKALIRRDAGDLQDYLDDLEDALVYAGQMGFDNLADLLEAVIEIEYNKNQ